MERAPYIYQLIKVHGGPIPSKEQRRVLERKRWQSPESWRWEGCAWNEEVIHESEDQAEINELFATAVKNCNGGGSKHIERLYVRRLGYPAPVQDWHAPRTEPVDDVDRVPGLPDTERSARPRAGVKGEKRSGP